MKSTRRSFLQFMTALVATPAVAKVVTHEPIKTLANVPPNEFEGLLKPAYRGQIVWNKTPKSGAPVAWVCTVGGEHPTWRPMAPLA